MNIRHIEPKLETVIRIKSNQIDILGVCGTFINKSLEETLLHIDRFTFERKDRDTCYEIDANNEGGHVDLTLKPLMLSLFGLKLN